MSSYFQYATGVTAKIIGKPSCDYFYSAARSLELKPEDVSILYFIIAILHIFSLHFVKTLKKKFSLVKAGRIN